MTVKYTLKNSAGDKKKRAVLSDSESEGDSKADKRKKESDSGSDTSGKPKRKTKKLQDSDDDKAKDDNGIICFLMLKHNTVSSTCLS